MTFDRVWLQGPRSSQAILLNLATSEFTVHHGAEPGDHHGAEPGERMAGTALVATRHGLIGWLVLEDGGPLQLLAGTRIIPFSRVNSVVREWRWHRVVAVLTVKVIGEPLMRFRQVDWGREFMRVTDTTYDELDELADDDFGTIEEVFRRTDLQRQIASRLSPSAGPWHLLD